MRIICLVMLSTDSSFLANLLLSMLI
uniref:Uncharacterized protein n=1 Tax=Rhizophora mucronata TaxID=61149 RepID=A0A2P2NF45_RHIMU